MRNRWWDEGYTWRSLVSASGAFVLLALVFGSLGLSAGVDEWWWILPAGWLVIGGLWAWRARKLFVIERSRAEESEQPDEGEGAG